MQPFLEIGQVFISTFVLAFIMPIFWIVLFLVYLQYRRLAATEEKLFGCVISGVGRQVLLSVALGALGGFAASAILIFLGLSLEQIGLYFIWPVALLLLLFNPRYLCFSYAGGIVAFAALIGRNILLPLFPLLEKNFIFESLLMIHIPALLVLIGLLHLVEALLIYFGGHWGSSPIYLKRAGGEVVGAFTLQRFWPIPLVALLVTVIAQTEIVGVSMPDWWPILESNLDPGEGQSLQYMVIPIAAGLGYADMALSSTPREKTAFSAKWLAAYSIVLLVIAIGSEFMSWLVLPGVFFAPLGHELLILYGKKQEESRSPRYRMPEAGVPIMKVLPNSPAADAGLLDDDLVLTVNGNSVNNNKELVNRIEDSYFLVLLDGLRESSPFSVILHKPNKKNETLTESFQGRLNAQYSHSLLHRSANLGLIPVPAPDSPVYMEIRKPDPMGRFKYLKNKVAGWIKRQ
ncbi:MAG: PDZ domain-containing protein [Bacillota bacterium]